MGIGYHYFQKHKKVEKENIKYALNKVNNNPIKEKKTISKKEVHKKREIPNFIFADDSYIFLDIIIPLLFSVQMEY